jgi:Ca2+-binding EF-hand superfamily protein
VVDYVTGRNESAGLTFEQFADLIRINLRSTVEARLQRRFDMFDADQSGEVSLEKFIAYIRDLNGLITTAEAVAMFKECDRDGNGSLLMQEFMGTMERRFSVGGNESEIAAAAQCLATEVLRG